MDEWVKRDVLHTHNGLFDPKKKYCHLQQYGWTLNTLGFLGSSDGKASACNAGDPGSIPGLGRSPGEGNGNPLQYSYLENPMDRGAS